MNSVRHDSFRIIPMLFTSKSLKHASAIWMSAAFLVVVLTTLAVLSRIKARSYGKRTPAVGRPVRHDEAYVEAQLRACERSCRELTATYGSALQRTSAAQIYYDNASFAWGNGQANGRRLISSRLLLVVRQIQLKTVSNQLDRAHASWTSSIAAFKQTSGGISPTRPAVTRNGEGIGVAISPDAGPPD
jgi:hypothetical protein